MNTQPLHRFVIPELTRTPEQRKLYQEINSLELCPFCSDESFEKFHKGEVIFKNSNWVLSTNDTPYEGTKLHLLLVFRGRHIHHICNLSLPEWILLKEVLDFCHEKFTIDSGAFLMRFGIPGHNGSSVEHLHAHIISGEGEMSEEGPRIRVKVGYGKKA